MADETPILRADALDDDLQLDDEPRFATGGVIEHDPAPNGDEVPALLHPGCEYLIPADSVSEEFKRSVQGFMEGNDELLSRLADS